MVRNGLSKRVAIVLEKMRFIILGRLIVQFYKRVKPNKNFIVIGWKLSEEGRKIYAGTAIYLAEGELYAKGKVTWIEFKYDKWHVCSTGDCCEKRFFKNGKRPLEVFDVFGVRVGLCICYDIRFPELTRYLAVDKEISLLLHPGGWPRDKGFFTWHTFVITRAMENTIYIMSTNWAGLNNGRTAFCPPFVDGNKACLSRLESKPGVLIGTVDMAHIENEREKYPYLKDRNQDMYAKLAKRV